MSPAPNFEPITSQDRFNQEVVFILHLFAGHDVQPVNVRDSLDRLKAYAWRTEIAHFERLFGSPPRPDAEMEASHG